jgi:hypothetical protein
VCLPQLNFLGHPQERRAASTARISGTICPIIREIAIASIWYRALARRHPADSDSCSSFSYQMRAVWKVLIFF